MVEIVSSLNFVRGDGLKADRRLDEGPGLTEGGSIAAELGEVKVDTH